MFLEAHALIKQSISQVNPNMVILQEAKLSQIDSVIVKSFWSSHGINWAALDATRTVGGILILWNDLDFVAVEIRKVSSPSL